MLVKHIFYLLLLLFSAPFAHCQSSIDLNALFVGEISEKVEKQAVYLGDIVAFYVGPNDRFICRFNADGNFQITLSDGKNGLVKSRNIKKSANQDLFKITYPESSFPFSNTPSIFGRSQYSNCNFSAVLYWLKYFKETTDFVALTRKAFNKDTAAFFSLMRQPFLDVDGSRQWSFNNWKLINSFSDKEFSTMIVNGNTKRRIDIVLGLYPDLTITPFGEESNFIDTYYKTWYPLTWSLIEFERGNEIHNKKYYKEFNKLKKKIIRSS